MNSFVFLGIIGCTLAVPNLLHGKERLDDLILGGQPVNIEDYPYQLSIQVDGHHANCGASIISNEWALTATHCMKHHRDLDRRRLSLVSNSSFHDNKRQGAIVHQISDFFLHELYKKQIISDYDIAVIKIEGSFLSPDSKAAAVQLPDVQDSLKPGDLAVVSGWGDTREDKYSLGAEQLRAVEVPIVARQKCQTSYETTTITERMLCAGFDEGGKDACSGDSGGPLVVNGKQYGVVSWGSGCVRAVPTVYADVANLRDWIRLKTGI